MSEFNPNSPLAVPTDDRPGSYEHDQMDVSHPPADADGDEYLCGNTGNAHPYANPGRDQDRARLDESIPAQGTARYIS